MLEDRETTARFTLESVKWSDPRAIALRRAMDADTEQRYNAGGARHEDPAFTSKRARALAVASSEVRATLLALAPDGDPIGHAVLRRLGIEWELKKLFVTPRARGMGVATALLVEAETRAAADGAPRLILQTGEKQPEAIALYLRNGFTRIPVYEPYIETMANSICFEKTFDTQI